MIQTRNEIQIGAPAQRIFGLASATLRWPQILPHYRSVRLVADEGDSQILQMAAVRGFIPVRWTAQQWNDAVTPSIRFLHIAGWTRGMHVAWHFEELAGVTLVSIVHDLDFQFPVASAFLGKYLVSGFFVHDIANKTLRRIKELAEGA
jgi:ribosome-associated toxin RatA of RatAB toxin-antitoxin module